MGRACCWFCAGMALLLLRAMMGCGFRSVPRWVRAQSGGFPKPVEERHHHAVAKSVVLEASVYLRAYQRSLSAHDLRLLDRSVARCLAFLERPSGIASSEEAVTRRGVQKALEALNAHHRALEASKRSVLTHIHEPFDTKAEQHFGIGVCLVTLAMAIGLAFNGLFALGALPGYLLCRRMVAARNARNAGLERIMEEKKKREALKEASLESLKALDTFLGRLRELDGQDEPPCPANPQR